MFKYFIELLFGFGLFINAMLFVPQAIKVYKTKSSNNLSAITFLGFNVIQIATILHGHIHEDYILMIGSALSFMTSGAVTFLIFFYEKKKL